MKAALLLVDLQYDFLNSPGLQPPAGKVISKTAALLEACRRRQVPVVHIWTTHRPGEDRRLPHLKAAGRQVCVEGTHGHRTPEVLRPVEGETIVHKYAFNAFLSGELEAALRRLACTTVILAGVHFHTCVRTAATESLERGLEVSVCDDATGTNDPVLAAATRRWLAERCVRFESCGAVLRRIEGLAPAKWIHRSPRDLAVELFEVASAPVAEIAVATAAAREAWEVWRNSRWPVRCQLLEKFAEQLEGAAGALAMQMAVEVGKPFSHGMEELKRAAENVRDVIRRAEKFQGSEHEKNGDVCHLPLGVVALISPWNNPVAIPAGKLAPALIYGNAVVWKPAPAASRIALEVLGILRKAGAPNDLVRIVTGGPETAQVLASDKNIDAVTLTGSARAGYAIQEICARRFVPLQAELSGNNAAIVWDDADFTDAATKIAWGAFGFAGQRCTANRRVIVSNGKFGRWMDEIGVRAQALRLGDPLEPHTEIGPVIDAAKRDEVVELVQAARNECGAQRVQLLHEDEARTDWFRAGAYAQPAVIACDSPESSLVQEETMGPVLVVQRAEDFDHALQLCNGVRHGLAASVFTLSTALAEKFFKEARAGILKFCSSTAGADVTLPFGGWKTSGIGPPEHGIADVLFYTRMQAVYGPTGQRHKSRSP